MLSKVILKNFQAHKNLELELGKFTTLTGGSNGGKSAVLRAINALVRNESATDYVRYGQKSLSVTLEFSDGHSVQWIKGGGENKYILTTPEGLSQTFDKVGADVPDEVKEVLKLGPIEIKGGDKEYVNFHSQLEAPFLISHTPGGVAKLLGELTSASQLYAAVGEGNRRVRATGALRSTRVLDLNNLKKELETFSNLSEDEANLDRSLSIISTIKKVETQINELTKVCTGLNSAVNELKKVDSAIHTLTECCKTSLIDLDSRAVDIAQFSKVIDSAISISTDLKKMSAAVSYLENAVRVDLDNLETKTALINTLLTLITAIEGVSTDLIKSNDNIAKTESLISNIDKELTGLLEALDECPTCGTELSDDAKLTMLASGEIHAAH